MEEPEKRKGGGAKLTRSETVTVRLEPKLRYLAELAGRKQRRTLSSFIEWSIQASLERVVLEEDEYNQEEVTVAGAAERLWDVDEEDRFAKLALHFPDLLTHDEQVLWKLVKECGALWKGRYAKPDLDWTWAVQESSLNFEKLHEHWATFNAVAKGEAPRSALPTWAKHDPKDPDDIPF